MTEYRTILYVMGIALVEIRASEKIAKSRALADIFHNVPAGISTEKPEAEIVQEVMSRAARLGHVDKRDSHRAWSVIQAGICDGDQLGTRPDVGRGVGVL